MNDIHTILADWQNVRVRMVGDLVSISGSFGGVEHSGARVDGVSLALHMDQIARGDRPRDLEPTTESVPVALEQATDEASPPIPAASVADLFDPEPEPEPEPEPDPEPQSLDALASAGLMLVQDELAWRVGMLTGRIAQYAEQRITARYDASARQDMAQAMSNHTNKVALSLPVTDVECDAFDAAQAADRWIIETRAFAQSLYLQLPDLPLNMLQAYNVEEAPWP
jgi:hypothetical protein